MNDFLFHDCLHYNRCTKIVQISHGAFEHLFQYLVNYFNEQLNNQILEFIEAEVKNLY